MVDRDVIEFECPRCLKSIRVASNKAGERMDCPSCNGSLLVPKANSGQDLFNDIFDSSAKPQSKPEPPKASSPDTRSETESGLEIDSEESDEDLLAGVVIPDSTEGSNPLAGDDPFEVKEDAPLKVDGISDLFSHADVYGIKCKICDTRIHVRPDQVDTQVECPECYSKVLVTPPTKDSKASQRWVKENHDKKPKPSAEDELKLSAPVERRTPKIDESYGLEAPLEDLLAPKSNQFPPNSEGDEYGLEIIDDEEKVESVAKPAPAPVQSSRPTASPKSGKRNLSRREQYEESQRRQQALDSGIDYRPAESVDAPVQSNFPSFDFSTLLSSAIEMIKSPGVWWRVVIAVALMCFGTIGMQWFFPDSAVVPKDGEEGTMIQKLTRWAAWGFVGGIPYLMGLTMLWFTSAYIYRDAALGNRHVKSWKNAGSSEVTGTFLIFGFGFFIGGLFMPPFSIFTYLILPLRMLLAPIFLLSTWYSQAPFSIVNVDAFKNINQNMGHWIAFYKFMFALAVASLGVGLIFFLRAFIPGAAFALTGIVSIIGVLAMSAVTLVFAAVCGWHCGKVVEGLEDSA